MNESYKVSIVIPSFNGRGLLLENLPKVIAAWENAANRIIEIIVVDDGSSDDSVKAVKEVFPGARLIKHKINRGFSSAVNTGVRMSKGNLVTLLNNDVVPAKDFLASLLPNFNDKKVFAVSLHEEGYSWGKADFSSGYLSLGQGKPSETTEKSFWASGGSAVFRRETWVSLGGLDEKLFSPFYWEDIDLSYRAAKRGFEILWEPKARVSHIHESTVNKLSKTRVQKVRERNELFFIWKNITSASLIRKHFVALAGRTLKHPGYLRIVMAALFKLPTVLKARRREVREAKLSDEIIFQRFQ
jgi:GT2 family glycosyltransferase